MVIARFRWGSLAHFSRFKGKVQGVGHFPYVLAFKKLDESSTQLDLAYGRSEMLRFGSNSPGGIYERIGVRYDRNANGSYFYLYLSRL